MMQLLRMKQSPPNAKSNTQCCCCTFTCWLYKTNLLQLMHLRNMTLLLLHMLHLLLLLYLLLLLHIITNRRDACAVIDAIATFDRLAAQAGVSIVVARAAKADLTQKLHLMVLTHLTLFCTYCPAVFFA